MLRSRKKWRTRFYLTGARRRIRSGYFMFHHTKAYSSLHLVLLLVFVSCLTQCNLSAREGRQADDLLPAPGFRLLTLPDQIVNWHYYYVNRSFSLPSYRTPEGAPLPGWGLQVVATRRFFTDQSARIYYRIKDLRQSKVFSLDQTAVAPFGRIWPLNTIIVLETYAGQGALESTASPSSVDCIRKYKPSAHDFPVDALYASEWCYQRFDVNGKVLDLPRGGSGCHQCHTAALHLTGDLVFTVFPNAGK